MYETIVKTHQMFLFFHLFDLKDHNLVLKNLKIGKQPPSTIRHIRVLQTINVPAPKKYTLLPTPRNFQAYAPCSQKPYRTVIYYNISTLTDLVSTIATISTVSVGTIHKRRTQTS